jgi:hypothetical protein
MSSFRLGVVIAFADRKATCSLLPSSLELTLRFSLQWTITLCLPSDFSFVLSSSLCRLHMTIVGAENANSVQTLFRISSLPSFSALTHDLPFLWPVISLVLTHRSRLI